MQIKNELYNSLQGLNNSLNNLLNDSYLSPTDSKLERFLYTLEKKRFEIYEQVRFSNDITEGNKIYFIGNDYKATLKDDVLSLYIPEKLPNLKNRSSYAHKQIILNIAKITKPYEKLFYDKFVIVVVKIFEKKKYGMLIIELLNQFKMGLFMVELLKMSIYFIVVIWYKGFTLILLILNLVIFIQIIFFS